MSSMCIKNVYLSRTISILFFMSIAHILYAEEDTLLADNSNSFNISAIETLIVQGYRINPLGEMLSASEGLIGSTELADRPVSRTGEILEFIPGMVVTQHSGSGKANQYFLRGFNLNHGTDFNTRIDGMPVNMRTHGHGQGYTDLNFIIPEFIDSIQYHKGPYYADVGDFSGAGAAAFTLKNSFRKNEISTTFGENNYNRVLAAGQTELLSGQLLLGIEAHTYDGPWSDINEDVNKKNLMGRYTSSINEGDFSLTFMAYKNRWNSADQIPERAVKQNIVDEFGSLDTGVGGASSRFSVSSSWQSTAWAANLYAIRSTLDLFSNFTYFLDDPVNGDQFEQVDDRDIFGGALTQKWTKDLFGKSLANEVGAEIRYDNIDNLGLYHTEERMRLSTTRQDVVDEASVGIFNQTTLALTEKLNTHIGLRYDYFAADVDSNINANSGDASQGKISIKVGATYRISELIETYINAGQGMHSNDARGSTITQDPITGDASDAVNLLVPSTGAEVGIKIFDAQHFNLSASLWYLSSESELVFVGDAGNTEASRASKRNGLELAGYYWIDNRWSFDTQLAWTRANFTENTRADGKYIDGPVPFVASAGISYKAQTNGFHSSLRYRYFGARRLDGFNVHRADATGMTNLGLGYRWNTFEFELDILNAFDSLDHDIDYFYASRLQGESDEGVEDLHFHPVEPRTFRVKLAYHF